VTALWLVKTVWLPPKVTQRPASNKMIVFKRLDYKDVHTSFTSIRLSMSLKTPKEAKYVRMGWKVVPIPVF